MFTKGQADSTKLVTDFFTPITQMISNNSKGTTGSQSAYSNPGFKIALISISSALFEACWTRIPMPPSKELYECYTKFNAKVTDKEIRASGFTALSKILKQNPSNLFQFQQDLLKNLIKGLKDEKSEEVRG